MELKNKRVLVVGLGRSGVSSAIFLQEHGAKVIVSDSKAEAQLQKEVPALLDRGISIETGSHGERTFRDQDLIVVSPGVPSDQPQLQHARTLGIPVIGEVELAYRFLKGKVLAITGSNGKTTTKEMVAAILAQARLDGQRLRGKVLKTEGNFNNLVGLPLTLLRLTKKHRVAVVELGTNQPGEIQRLAEIADPDFGVITSVAAAHLEGLKNLAGVAREKGALYRCVRPDGTIAVNLDDPWVRRLGASFSGEKLTYGAAGRLRARSLRVRNAHGMAFDLHFGQQRARVRLNYLGRHNVTNALGAAALALAAGVSLAAVRRGLAEAKPFTMRMQRQSWRGVGILNDSYNANPGSMKAALETLALIGSRGKKIAVLGDMYELGNQSRKAHRDLGRIAANAKIDKLYLLGDQARQVRAGALRAGMRSAQVTIGADHSDLARGLRQQLRRGDWLLVKGSRGMKMEKVIQELESEKG